jgi:hypothetical protein
MNKEFIPYEQALALKKLGFDEPCLAHLIGFGDGTKENGRYKINQQQVFYPNDYTSSDDKAEELGLHPFGMCGVPLYQQAFRWFRENHNLVYQINYLYNGNYQVVIYKNTHEYMKLIQGLEHACVDEIPDNYSYEEAELACLEKLIEIVKENKQ